MKTVYRLLFLALSALLITSCIMEDDVEEATLTLSEMSYKFPKATSEKSIEVSTNQAKWVAVPNVEWLEVNQMGNTLVIRALENISTEPRKGRIVVIAGGITQVFEAEQSEADVEIVMLPDKLEVDSRGGKYGFEVESNTTDWLASSDVEWVKVEARQEKGLVAIVVDENKDRAKREAKITIKGGKETKEFTLIQDGILYYIMPYQKIDASIDEIIEFEYARGSKLSKIPDGYINTDVWEFTTLSPVFPWVRYIIRSSYLAKDDKKYVYAVLLPSDDNVIINTDEKKIRPEMIEFMKGCGFPKERFDNMFYNEEKEQLFSIEVDDDGYFLRLQPFPKQPKKQDTFREMPYPCIDFAVAKEADVFEYEKLNGGTFLMNIVDEWEEDLRKNCHFSALAPWSNRSYWFGLKEPHALEESVQTFGNLSLGVYSHTWDDYDYKYYLTEEFVSLLKSEGYKLLTAIWFKELYAYYNLEKNLLLQIKTIQRNEFNDGERVFFINVSQIVPQTPKMAMKNYSEEEIKQMLLKRVYDGIKKDDPSVKEIKTRE